MAARFSQLRELARRYSAGQLASTEYRQQRAALLGDIAAGRTKIEYRDITPPKPAAPPTYIMDVGEDEPATRRIPIIMGTAALLAALGVGGWLVLQTQTAPPATIQHVAPKDQAVAAIEEFLNSKDWSSAGVAAFQSRWDSFTPEQQANARSDGAFVRLETELRVRVEDQVSLASGDATSSASAEAARLTEFAAHMGIKVK